MTFVNAPVLECIQIELKIRRRKDCRVVSCQEHFINNKKEVWPSLVYGSGLENHQS